MRSLQFTPLIIFLSSYLLIILISFYSSYIGNFNETIFFLFKPDFSSITPEVVISAMGQAFFSLSIGMGAIMAYGAYMPERQVIGKTVLTIIILDTLVALCAGIAIFPIVFSNTSLEVSAGPGLIFETLPVAFYSLPFGNLFSIIFFTLISIAALSSSISLLEPFTAWMEEKLKMHRRTIVVCLGFLVWFLGMGSIFSFNIWSDLKFLGINFLELMDYLTNNIMLPVGGFFISIFVGWVLPNSLVQKYVKLNDQLFKIFIFFLKYVSTGAIALIFLYSVL